MLSEEGSDMADGESVVEVAEYSGALRRWWLVILGCALVGAALGALLFRFQATQYVSSAQVEVRPLVIQGDDPDLDADRQVNTTTERSIASSQRVAERALALLAAAESVAGEDGNA